MAKITGLPVAHAVAGDEHLPIVQLGLTKRMTLASLRAAIVPFLQSWYKGDVGEAGGNVMATGLFVEAAQQLSGDRLTVPATTDALRTAGHTEVGIGIADYAVDPLVDANYVAAHPDTSFLTADGRGWRLRGPIAPESFGARGGAHSASAISASIARGGTVNLRAGDGPYLAEEPIVVGEGARLLGAGEPVLRQIVGRNGNVIVNAAYLREPTIVEGAGAGINSVNWDVAQPFRLPVTWYDHGLQVGDWVWLENTERTEYSGVFPVIEVGNSANIVLKLRKMPVGNPTGVTRARRADTDIDLDRIVADYDRAGNGDGNPGPQTHTIVLAGVAGLRARATVRNTKKFAICLGAVVDVDVDLTGWDLFSDGVKIYGPAWRGHIRVRGTTGDDMLSFHCREADEFAAYRFSQGDVEDFTAEVVAGAGADGVVVMTSIYPTEWGGATIGNIDITLHGHLDAPAVNIVDYTGNSRVGEITIRHNARAKYAFQIARVGNAAGATKVDRINLHLLDGAYSTGGDPLGRIAPACRVGRLHLSGRGIDMGRPASLVICEGDLEEITCDDGFEYETEGSSFAVFTNGAKSVRRIAFNGARVDVTGTMIRADGVALPAGCSISSTPGGRLKAGLNIVDTQSSLALDFGGHVLPGQHALAMYLATGSVTTLAAGPGVLRSGEWATRVTGDGLVAPRSFDVTLDIRAGFIERAPGNRMQLDANTAGTLRAGALVAFNAGTAKFHDITDPALTD